MAAMVLTTTLTMVMLSASGQTVPIEQAIDLPVLTPMASAMTCMQQAQMRAAAWIADEHPGFVLRSWTCHVGNHGPERGA
jgi:hypothetical protein